MSKKMWFRIIAYAITVLMFVLFTVDSTFNFASDFSIDKTTAVFSALLVGLSLKSLVASALAIGIMLIISYLGDIGGEKPTRGGKLVFRFATYLTVTLLLELWSMYMVFDTASQFQISQITGALTTHVFERALMAAFSSVVIVVLMYAMSIPMSIIRNGLPKNSSSK
jgi:hypothetical protein